MTKSSSIKESSLISCPAPAVGQVWKDLDKRNLGRWVRIERIEGDRALVMRVERARKNDLIAGLDIWVPLMRPGPGGPEGREGSIPSYPPRVSIYQSTIRLDRFRPGSVGYELMAEGSGGRERAEEPSHDA